MAYLDMARQYERDLAPAPSDAEVVTTPGACPTETPPGGLDEATAKRLHDETLLRLAEDVPRGFIRWAQAHKPKEWQKLEADYTQARLLLMTGDYTAGLAAVEQWAEANRKLFEEYLRARTPAEMPPDEAERAIIEVFDAVPVPPMRHEKFDLLTGDTSEGGDPAGGACPGHKPPSGHRPDTDADTGTDTD